jgi:phage regulator Rha-like protein
VTARYNEAHVKVFEEERELTMMLWSIFQGRKVLALKANLKDIVTEIAATMAFLQRRIMIK